MKAQQLVVLGGTGFVGSHLLPRLHKDGHGMLVLSRNRETARSLSVLPGVRIQSADVYDPAVLAAQFAGADAIIDLVGILNERGFDGSGFRRAHVEFTAQVIEAMKRAGVTRLIKMSSLKAGQGESHYLKTRGEAEALVKSSGLAWTILQPSVIFGAGDGLYTRFAGLLKLAPMLPIGRASARLQPVFVGDVCHAVARALDDPHTATRTYELYGPEVYTLRQIVEQTRDWLGLKRAVVALPEPLGWLQAATLQLVPGKPLSLDNFRSLAVDSTGTRDGLAELGIAKTRVASVVPRLLRGEEGKQDELDAYRQRRDG